MNKEYTYINGNVIVRDENGNQKVVDSYKNLEEVLIQENIIEATEKKIEKLEKEIELDKYKKLSKRFIPFDFIIFILISSLIPPIIYNIIKNNMGLDLYKEMITVSNSVTSTASFTNKFIFAICFLFGTYFSTLDYIDYRQKKKKIKGINTELLYLKEMLKQEIEDLEIIKNKNKEKKTKEEFVTKKIDDKYELNDLEEWMNFYYSLGYDEKKLLKYIRKGILEKKLEKDYTPVGIEMIKEHFEDDKKLVKKR